MDKNYLKALEPAHQLVIASFFANNPAALAILEAQWAKRDPAHKTSQMGRSEKEMAQVTSKELGGSIAVIDPTNFEAGFIAEMDCPSATGLFFDSKESALYVGGNKWIHVVSHGQIVREIGNRLFNDIHTVRKTADGHLLVASTGVDGILEIDPQTGTTIWDWLAPEHGINKTPSGKTRIIDRSANYQEMGTSTPMHTTHLNSAFDYKPGKILATLFHQGWLIEIDKQDKSYRVLVDGMQSPHAIRRTKEGFVVSDTRNNRVLLLDQSFKISKEFSDDYRWVQDCIQLEDGDFLIADSNNSRLVRVDDDGGRKDIFTIPAGTRKFSTFLTVTAQQALEIFYGE